jgi:RNA polymerase sigma factor (sigma-70 family)
MSQVRAVAAPEGLMAESDDERTRTEIERLLPELLIVGRYLLGSDSEAQDLVQDTAEKALRRRGQLRDPSKLRAWLITIETREAWRWRRRLRRVLSLDAEVREIPASGPSMERNVVVRDAVRRLPARTRTAVVLHHMAGLSVDETALALGVSQNTVKSQLRVGIARLREELR